MVPTPALWATKHAAVILSLTTGSKNKSFVFKIKRTARSPESVSLTMREKTLHSLLQPRTSLTIFHCSNFNGAQTSLA